MVEFYVTTFVERADMAKRAEWSLTFAGIWQRCHSAFGHFLHTALKENNNGVDNTE